MSHAEIALQEELREAVKEMAKRRIEIERLRAENAKLLALLQEIIHPDNETIIYFVPSDAHAMKVRDDIRAALAEQDKE